MVLSSSVFLVFVWFLREVQCIAQVKVIFPHLWGKLFLQTLPSGLWIMKFSHCRHCSRSSKSPGYCFLQSFWMGLCLSLSNFLISTVLNEYSRGPSADLWGLLSVQHSPLWYFILWTLGSCIDLPTLSIPSP